MPTPARSNCTATHRNGRSKEQSIQALFSERFEAELQKLATGLHKKGTVKRYEKVLERLGRLKQKYARAAQYYDVTVEHDETRNHATGLRWARNNRPPTTPCQGSTACAPIRTHGMSRPSGTPIRCSPISRPSFAAYRQNLGYDPFFSTTPSAEARISLSRCSLIIWRTPLAFNSRPAGFI